MIKTTVRVEGMACSMCEAHINDAVRAKFQVKKVSSSRSKERTEILSEMPLDAQTLVATIEQTGYRASDVRSEEYVKKSFFRK